MIVNRVAIFVDAGYLFAQGSVALFGSKQPRSLLVLDASAVLAELQILAVAKANNRELLRTYWYDGASFKGPTIEQTELGHLDNVKIRLGLLNKSGEQKGVDSLIVTDLIELGRLGSICDALLLSGDEDVRVGVQVAQSYGVRVHLLGITPSRGSQSKSLLQEADTTTTWEKPTIEKFLSMKPTAAATGTMAAAPIAVAVTASFNPDPRIEKVVIELVATLDDTQVAGIHDFWTNNNGVPFEFDSKLLVNCRSELARDLTENERRHARAKFKEAVRQKTPS